jgi:hypothetical protein
MKVHQELEGPLRRSRSNGEKQPMFITCNFPIEQSPDRIQRRRGTVLRSEFGVWSLGSEFGVHSDAGVWPISKSFSAS